MTFQGLLKYEAIFNDSIYIVVFSLRGVLQLFPFCVIFIHNVFARNISAYSRISADTLELVDQSERLFMVTRLLSSIGDAIQIDSNVLRLARDVRYPILQTVQKNDAWD